jgi:hypothetical protein
MSDKERDSSMSSANSNSSSNNLNDEFKGKLIVGLTEYVVIKGSQKNKEVIARMDSGATKSSIDISMASELNLGPVVDSRLIKSAHGSKLRPVVEVEILIKNRHIKARFTVADRNHMHYPVLIGQNVLRNGFLIDPSRRVDTPARVKPEGQK